MDLNLIPSIVFCSLGVMLVCLAIFQVRRERTELHKRMTQIENIQADLEGKYQAIGRVIGSITVEIAKRSL